MTLTNLKSVINVSDLENYVNHQNHSLIGDLELFLKRSSINWRKRKGVEYDRY